MLENKIKEIQKSKGRNFVSVREQLIQFSPMDLWIVLGLCFMLIKSKLLIFLKNEKLYQKIRKYIFDYRNFEERKRRCYQPDYQIVS